jgi:protein tyrosine/serine phosphatase
MNDLPENKVNENKLRTKGAASVVIVCLIGIFTCYSTTIIPIAFAGSAATAATGSAHLPDGAHLSEHIYGNLPGLENVGRVAPGIYRGAQPAKEGYATLKRMGIRTVINLRNSMSEKGAVERAGMRSIEVPMEMSRDGLRAKVDGVVALMADPANRPVLVHCRHGRDRTGIVVAAYRMKMQGWPLADAEAEMQAFGFNDVWVNYKQFIRNYGSKLVGK